MNENNSREFSELELCEIIKGKALANDIMQNAEKYELCTKPILLPRWYNHELVIKGQEYFWNNLFVAFVCKLCGLVVILAVPSILYILSKTNKSSSPADAYKRYMNTINHMMQWYESDLRNPNSRGRQSILDVRGKHCSASKFAKQITQKDLVLTQFGFMGFTVLHNKAIGLHGKQIGFIHFWRVIGYFIGIDDRFNLCKGSSICTRAACQELAEMVFKVNLKNPPDKFDEMSFNLLEGMWPVIPFLNYDAFLEITKRFCGISPHKVSFVATILVNFQLLTHRLLTYKIFAIILIPLLNFNTWLAIFLQSTMPVLAYIKFRPINS